MRLQAPKPLRTRPSVSVVIPHYNYGRYLPTAVGSALDQPGVDLEIIIVDDRSTDGSVETASRLAAAHDCITLIEHRKNLGHISTYNDGLARASGQYVVLLSADDALTPGSLARAVALMEANPGVGLTYGRVARFVGEPPVPRQQRQWWQVWDGREWIGRVVRRGRNAIASPEVVMRRTVYNDTGGYDPEFPHAGDLLMWLRAAARADVGFVGGVLQAAYRGHDDNMHSTSFGGLLDDMTQVRGAYSRLLEVDRPRLLHPVRLHRAAMGAVAREALLRGALLATQGGAPETLAPFRRFAFETCPSASRSTTWRWASLAASPRVPAAVLLRETERLRWRVRSKRTDLVGL